MPQNYILASTVQLLDTYQRCGLKRKQCDSDLEVTSTTKQCMSSTASVHSTSTKQYTHTNSGKHTVSLLDSKINGKVPHGGGRHHPAGTLPHSLPHGTMAGNSGETIKTSSTKV